MFDPTSRATNLPSGDVTAPLPKPASLPVTKFTAAAHPQAIAIDDAELRTANLGALETQQQIVATPFDAGDLEPHLTPRLQTPTSKAFPIPKSPLVVGLAVGIWECLGTWELEVGS